MMTLESYKTMGGIGAILLFIGFIPVQYVSILGLIGLILVLIAMNGFANIYRERGIFNNLLYGVIAAIVGGAIAVAIAVVSFLTTLTSLLYQLYPGWNGDWSALAGMTPDVSNISLEDLLPLVGEFILVFVVICVFIIVAAFFARRSFNALSVKTGVHLFSTGALLLLIGAVLTIVIVGVILIWISVLLIAIAYFQIRAQPTPAATVAPPPPAPA